MQRLAAILTFLCLWYAGISASSFAAEHKVVIDGMKYLPESLTVKAGDTIRWINKDPFPHTATARSGGLDSPQIASGQSWKYVARKKGSYSVVCTLHPTMKGQLIVK